jgi:hypothetical protein
MMDKFFKCENEIKNPSNCSGTGEGHTYIHKDGIPKTTFLVFISAENV